MKPLPLNSEEYGQTIRSVLYGAGIMGDYFLLIFNTHISFQSCNRRSTIDIRRPPDNLVGNRCILCLHRLIRNRGEAQARRASVFA